MLKLLMIPAVAALAVGHATHDVGGPAGYRELPAPIDELLDAARGADPLVCWFAADGVVNGSSGRLMGVPHPPLGRETAARARQVLRDTLDRRARDRVRQGISSSDACEREMAIRIVARHHREFDSAELNAMLGALFSDELSPARIGAAIVAGLAEASGAVDAVHAALADARVEVRANSAWALGRIRDPESVRHLARAAVDVEPSVRAASVVSLSRYRGQADDTLLARIVREDRSAEVRRTAVWALQRSRSTQAVQALARALGADQEEDVREMAAWALGHASSADAVDALALAVRNDRSSRVRATAVWAIGNIRPRRMPEGVLDVLTSENSELRLRAAWAAGQVRDREATPALRRAVAVERDTQVRRALVRALILSGDRDPEVVEALLRSDDEEVRRQAVLMLAGTSGASPWPWPQPRPYP